MMTKVNLKSLFTEENSYTVLQLLKKLIEEIEKGIPVIGVVDIENEDFTHKDILPTGEEPDETQLVLGLTQLNDEQYNEKLKLLYYFVKKGYVTYGLTNSEISENSIFAFSGYTDKNDHGIKLKEFYFIKGNTIIKINLTYSLFNPVITVELKSLSMEV